ncbi:small ribosomal subunit protein mS37 [Monosporozyma servazzii]
MSGRPTITRLPPLPRLRVKRPVIRQETNRCLVLMSNLLQCWSSNGQSNPVCEQLVREFKQCSMNQGVVMNGAGAGKGKKEIKKKKEIKSNINYHAARLYNMISGKPHD